MDLLARIISEAVNSPLGVRVETPHPTELRAKLYPRLKKLGLKLRLEIRPGELWLIKDQTNGERP